MSASWTRISTSASSSVGGTIAGRAGSAPVRRTSCTGCSTAATAGARCIPIRTQAGHPLYRERHGRPCGDERAGDRGAPRRRADRARSSARSSFGPTGASAWPSTPCPTRARASRPSVASGRRWGRAYADGTLPDAEYQARLSEIDARIREDHTVAANARGCGRALRRHTGALGGGAAGGAPRSRRAPDRTCLRGHREQARRRLYSVARVPVAACGSNTTKVPIEGGNPVSR